MCHSVSAYKKPKNTIFTKYIILYHYYGIEKLEKNFSKSKSMAKVINFNDNIVEIQNIRFDILNLK